LAKKITRCIHIFPRFKKNEKLQAIRKKYDYLHNCIEPHITLVFPFESTLSSEEIESDLKANLKDIKCFELSARGIEAVDDYGFHLFLNIEKGSDIIKELHYKLYRGILSSYQPKWTRNEAFVPHITIGRFYNKEDMHNALVDTRNNIELYASHVKEIYIEIIGEEEESIIESKISLL